MGFAPRAFNLPLDFLVFEFQRRLWQINVHARMRQNHRQPQAQHMRGEINVAAQNRAVFAQTTDLRTNQIRQITLRKARKARQIGIRHQIRAVAVVAVVRHRHADLVCHRRPTEALARQIVCIRCNLRVQRHGQCMHALCLCHIHAVTFHQAHHGLLAHVQTRIAATQLFE